MIIAIDFDGTICKWDRFPKVGTPIYLALETIRELIANGHKVYIWTVRDGNMGVMQVAEFLINNKIQYSGINVILEQKEYSTSPKLDADIYIDDKALGVPLTYDENDERFYVDWITVRHYLVRRGLIHEVR